MKKKFTQKQLLAFTAKYADFIDWSGSLLSERIFLEEHYATTEGHDVRLIAAQFVKSFVEVQQERLR